MLGEIQFVMVNGFINERPIPIIGFVGENDARQLKIVTFDDMSTVSAIELVIGNVEAGIFEKEQKVVSMFDRLNGIFVDKTRTTLSIYLTEEMLGDSGLKILQVVMYNETGEIVKKTNQFIVRVGDSNIPVYYAPETKTVKNLETYVKETNNEAIKLVFGLQEEVTSSNDFVNKKVPYVYKGNEEDYQNGYWYYYDDTQKKWLPGGQYKNPTDEVQRLLAQKQDVLTFDSTPTEGSQNPVTSGGTFTAIKEAQGMIPTTWAELKALRDNGQLIPGKVYRITDYICTTTQQGSRVESHPYDIIVMADSENALGEDARACIHDTESGEYYKHANIESWELKYSVDNNTNRFAWADEENGHGVVYYLKDNHGNECPYDFKQIQFIRYKITACTVSSLVGKYTSLQHGEAITGIDEQNPVWCYTFSYDPESTGIMSDASVMEFNADNNVDVSGNAIKAFYSYQDSDAGLQIAALNHIVFLGNVCRFNTFGNSCSFNTFGNNCLSNTFGDNFLINTFGDNCQSNTFGDNCLSNTSGNGYSSNVFGNFCASNKFGDNCTSNKFGDNCTSNKFGDNCTSNTFGNNCSSNTFRNNCSSNKFRNNCSSNAFGLSYSTNTFGNSCSSNTFGNFCASNTFGKACSSNKFRDYCSVNMFDTGCSFIDMSAGTSPQQKKNYHVLDGVRGSDSSRISINGTNGNNFVTYVGKNSAGELKTWVPADLAQ